ncbi:MAG TPA: DUF4442 domain-containing protein [Chitinophaga sp.]|uniref:DUF4442 domain-containing protein n=1 Tax=Chitinophaga sp. TaxID=1869181 RepID=UPI002C7055EE|nr:DUF4442 domain-containing protein [Chitinophaga sp.]HVI47023.1 DUF4442 domain-containing protein [Chitinophaga sp.]
MNNGITTINMDTVKSFMKFARQPFKFGAFMVWKLPAAWLAGVRLRSLDDESCVTSVPYKWLSQNPFRSTYFACLSMAAELSTGLPSMMYLRSASKRVSMLVTNMEGTFVKKATGRTFFTCSDLPALKSAIEKAVNQEEPVTIVVRSEGRDKEGTLIASFAFTWSFKGKS